MNCKKILNELNYTRTIFQNYRIIFTITVCVIHKTKTTWCNKNIKWNRIRIKPMFTINLHSVINKLQASFATKSYCRE